MRFALLLLASAALLSWTSFALDDREDAQAVVAAERRQPTAPVTPPAGRREGLSIRDVSAAPPTPALFRPAATPEALQALRPGQTFKLVGMAGGGEARIALLRDEADQEIFRARVGDDVRGWRLESLDARCAVLAQARHRQSACLA